MWTLTVPLGLNHISNFRFPRIQTAFIKYKAREFVKDTLPQPFKFELSRLLLPLLIGRLMFEGDGPELLWDEVLDLLVAVDDEAQGRELARTIAHYVVVLAI